MINSGSTSGNLSHHGDLRVGAAFTLRWKRNGIETGLFKAVRLLTIECCRTDTCPTDRVIGKASSIRFVSTGPGAITAGKGRGFGVLLRDVGDV